MLLWLMKMPPKKLFMLKLVLSKELAIAQWQLARWQLGNSLTAFSKLGDRVNFFWSQLDVRFFKVFFAVSLHKSTKFLSLVNIICIYVSSLFLLLIVLSEYIVFRIHCIIRIHLSTPSRPATPTIFQGLSSDFHIKW